jgi:hypothetical protein
MHMGWFGRGPGASLHAESPPVPVVGGGCKHSHVQLPIAHEGARPGDADDKVHAARHPHALDAGG